MPFQGVGSKLHMKELTCKEKNMGQKASLHMQPLKGMDAALTDENERRDKNKEWFDRAQDSKGNTYHYDWWRRNLNFEIVKGKIVPQLSQSIPLHERLKKRLTELGSKPYKPGATNAPNVVMDFVIGGDHDRMIEMAFGQQSVNVDSPDVRNSQLTRCNEIERWAMDTYQWAAKKYGEENVIGFNVHLDETSPHIHMQVIPVGNVMKRGRVKAGEDRGSKLAVSYAAVVGKTPEDLSRYLDAMHTDYHLQVGHKYGLERGDFFADLTPEEQAERRHRTKKEYDAYIKQKKEREKTRNEDAALKEENTALKQENTSLKKQNKYLETQNKQLEKKVKGLTTMLSNLEAQKDNLEAQIAALEDEYAENNEQLEQKRAELLAKLSEIEEKIADKTQKLSTAEKQLRDLDVIKAQTTQTIKKMAESATRRQDIIDARLKEAENAIKEKRAEVAKIDKTGELRRAQKYIEDRNTVIYRRWPEARNATDAIFQLGNSSTAKDFTPQQALDVEHAIATSGTTRTDAAKDLLSLAQKKFDDYRTPRGYIDGAAKVVQSIAHGTHQRLTALLSQQPKDAGGGPSYITDLTDWAGNQIHR